MAIEITAAGIDVENVRPALRPKYTLAAVNTSVMTMPIIRPRMVSSAGILSRICWLAFTTRLPILNYVARLLPDQCERRIVRGGQGGQDICAPNDRAIPGSEHLHRRALDTLR